MKRALCFVCVLFALVVMSCNDGYLNRFDDDFWGDDYWDDDYNRSPLTVTVAQAKNLRDDADVKIVGTIQRYVYREKYEFMDSTGTITLDIDYEAWYRGGIDPSALRLPAAFAIIGEVDKDYGYVEIDVDRVTRM